VTIFQSSLAAQVRVYRARRTVRLFNRDRYSGRLDLETVGYLDRKRRAFLAAALIVAVGSDPPRPPDSPARLVAWAARLTPVAERARYREEFEAELLEMAGEKQLRRFGYAVRVLGRAVPLRWALLRPARERAR